MEIKIVIEGSEPQKEYVLLNSEPITFVEVMKQLGVSFYRPCGGIGKCLSCAVRFVYGAPEITHDDERALDFSEMRNGWRLGCKSLITKDCKIQVPASLVSEIISPEIQDIDNELPVDKTNIAIAVDIGTTTIAVAVVDLRTGKILRQVNATNSQTKFGADVMTRIKAAIDGHSQELMDSVQSDLVQVGNKILGEDFQAHRIVFSANTTMTHLFLKYPVDGMATFPFVPYNTDSINFVTNYKDVFFMPAISAFIGGDIVSGLYYIKKKKNDEPFILADLGTNAELVLYDGEKYWCTSASAGPALEGANLSCGVASIRGAINHVQITSDKVKFTTIGGEKPIGICGSGIIDLIFELYRNGIIDDGGLLQDQYADTGYPVTENITITGEDIQQVLLAKSAIYSAIILLIKEAKMDMADIKHLYVSGGLGASIGVWSAAGINIFPKELIKKFESVGNSSLLGDIAYIQEPDQETLTAIKENSRIVYMAGNPEFEELFLENLRL